MRVIKHCNSDTNLYKKNSIINKKKNKIINNLNLENEPIHTPTKINKSEKLMKSIEK